MIRFQSIFNSICISLVVFYVLCIYIHIFLYGIHISSIIDIISISLIVSSLLRQTASWLTMPVPEKETLTALFRCFRFIVPVFCDKYVHYNCALDTTGYYHFYSQKCYDVTNFVRCVFFFFPFTLFVQSVFYLKRDKLKSHCRKPM